MLLAAGAAFILLIAVVLPAGFGIDPTGIGRLTGLVGLGEAKRWHSVSASADGGEDSISQTADGGTRVRVVIAPYASREVKGLLLAGEEMTYEWSAGGSEVEFDFHGETTEMSREESYMEGFKSAASGKHKAAFEGRHGWSWENKSLMPVTITVTVRGAVRKFAPMDVAAAASPTTSSAGTDAPYFLEMPMRPYMQRVMQPAAENAWAWQGYIDDEKGFRSLFPKNDEEWSKAENASLTLAEMTNNLLLPGRRVAEPEWDKAVLGVRRVALRMAGAAAKKNEKLYMEEAVALDAACEACHVRYDPTMQQ